MLHGEKGRMKVCNSRKIKVPHLELKNVFLVAKVLISEDTNKILY